MVYLPGKYRERRIREFDGDLEDFDRVLQDAGSARCRVIILARRLGSEAWEEVATYYEGAISRTPAGELDVPMPGKPELIAIGKKLGVRYVKAAIRAQI